MRDQDCVRFLQWALPRLDMRWQGFRKVRRQVCKRLRRRMRSLDCSDFDVYRRYLNAQAEEWRRLDHLCRVTISRFYRDRGVFDCLRDELIPRLARRALERGASRFTVLSLGCGRGEEPYSVSLIWHLTQARRFPGMGLTVVAVDSDSELIEQARVGCFGFSSLKELPEAWRSQGFERRRDLHCVRPVFHAPVRFLIQDIRVEMPAGPFDLVLCRNLAFTYFSEVLQRRIARGIADRLHRDGVLVLGSHERLPDGVAGFEPWRAGPPVYQRT